GLRSYNNDVPEEQDRIVTDHLSDMLFTPSDLANNNLVKEGITKGVREVGDVMMDAVMYNSKLAADRYSLERFKLKKKEYIVSTLHRTENTNDKEQLKRIFEGFSNVEQQIVMLLHHRTANLIKEYGLQE